MAFTFQPLSMNSTASQSSSSGIDGPFALRAEIIDGFDDAKAEVGLPEAIDGDAGGEWVAAIDKPFGEAETVGWEVGVDLRKDGRDAGRDHFAMRIVSAALEDIAFAGVGIIDHDHDGGDGIVIFFALFAGGEEIGRAVSLISGGAACVEEGEMQFGGLREGALGCRNGGDLRRCFASGERGAFFGQERFFIDANVFDGAFEIQAAGHADAEGNFLGVHFEGFVVLIEQNFGFLGDAIDI